MNEQTNEKTTKTLNTRKKTSSPVWDMPPLEQNTEGCIERLKCLWKCSKICYTKTENKLIQYQYFSLWQYCALVPLCTFLCV